MQFIFSYVFIMYLFIFGFFQTVFVCLDPSFRHITYLSQHSREYSRNSDGRTTIRQWSWCASRLRSWGMDWDWENIFISTIPIAHSPRKMKTTRNSRYSLNSFSCHGFAGHKIYRVITSGTAGNSANATAAAVTVAKQVHFPLNLFHAFTN